MIITSTKVALVAFLAIVLAIAIVLALITIAIVLALVAVAIVLALIAVSISRAITIVDRLIHRIAVFAAAALVAVAILIVAILLIVLHREAICSAKFVAIVLNEVVLAEAIRLSEPFGFAAMCWTVGRSVEFRLLELLLGRRLEAMWLFWLFWLFGSR